jgi:hypothetical protein
VLELQDGDVVHEHINGAESFIDDAVCARDAGDIGDVRANSHRAFRAGAELIYGTLERPIIAPGEDDAKPLFEQLTACLEPQATVRSRDERDAYARGCHRRILVAGSSGAPSSRTMTVKITANIATEYAAAIDR